MCSQQLWIHREEPATDLEGPGLRYAIWCSGCTIRCPGCCNPHLFERSSGVPVLVSELAARIFATDHIEGISLLGGEPLDQWEGVRELLGMVRPKGLSTMVFTGYTFAQIGKEPRFFDLPDLVDLLLDGPYQEDLRDTKRRWAGSRNQTFWFFSDRYRPDFPCFSQSNEVEISYKNGEMVITGFPLPKGKGGL